MQFYLMGNIDDSIAAALVRHGHKAHRPGEALAGATAPPADDSPAEVIAFLQAQQWNLVTSDSVWLRRLYEDKVEFPEGMIIHLLESAGGPGEGGAAIDRLFERYKRLTTKRMYTITGSRVKIRQLPGPPG